MDQGDAEFTIFHVYFSRHSKSKYIGWISSVEAMHACWEVCRDTVDQV